MILGRVDFVVRHRQYVTPPRQALMGRQFFDSATGAIPPRDPEHVRGLALDDQEMGGRHGFWAQKTRRVAGLRW
jgi:hypothetical protein